MLKSIQLRLVQLKYSGASIGRDIRVEIEALGQIFQSDHRIRPGQTVKIDRDAGRFETDKKTFQTDVLITVIEKDLLFNDSGGARVSVKVDTHKGISQQFISQVTVKERRSKLTKAKKIAVFEVMFEAAVYDVIRYVPDLDESQGFLKARLEDSKAVQELPAYLKVKVERRDEKREYFTILEGPYRGKLASVATKDDGSSWLISHIEHEPMALAKYSISQKGFFLNGKKYNTVDYPGAPWQKGLYDIEIPDYFHEGGRNYLGEAKRAGTWFRIGHSGDRYLHAGGRSLGCMTVIEIKRWQEIYSALIKERKGDFLSVGEIEIID